MKHRKSQIVTYSIACVIAIGAGLAYGHFEFNRTANISWEELIVLMSDKGLAVAQIQQIDFASINCPHPDFPRLELQLKNPKSKAVIVRPELKRVRWLLQQSAEFGINFSERTITQATFYHHESVVDLVKSGKRTKDYRNPPHCIIVDGEPADFAAVQVAGNTFTPKSPAQATPKYSETTSGGEGGGASGGTTYAR